MPIEKEHRPLTGSLGYEYRGSNHEPSHGYLRPVVDRFLRDVPQGSSILDLGCGNGSFLSLFRGRGWNLYGTDFSGTGIAWAQRTYPEIQFIHADASAAAGQEIAPLRGKMDVVLSTEVIEHLYDPRAFLRNAFEYLKPGGQIVLSTPYHGYAKNLALALAGSMDKHYTVLWDHGHIKFWSRKTLTTALEEAGFTAIGMAGAGRIPFLWKSMVLNGRKPS